MAEGGSPEGQESESAAERFFESAKLFEQPILATIGVVALVFGFIGYHAYFRDNGGPTSWVDVLYADMQLLKLTSKVGTGRAPWTLDVGRLLAPLVTGYAAFRGVASLHRERLDRIRIRRSRGHVVVLGATSAAFAVARALRRRGRRVVVVDPGLTAEQSIALRSAGVFTIADDPARADVLAEAAVRRAHEVIALREDDAGNVDLALRCRRPARAVGAVTRADLCELLRIEALGPNGSALLDFLNADEMTARVIDELFDGGIGASTQVLLAAPPALVAQLLARMARRQDAGSASQRPIVHLAGPDAPAALTQARRRATMLDVQVDARVATGDARGSISSTDAPLASVVGEVDRIVVGGDGPDTVALALELARAARAGAELVLVLPDPAHLAPLLATGASTREVPIHVVDSLGWWSDADLVLGGTVEVIARATHASYVATRTGTAKGDADPSLEPWNSLPEHLRTSNRAQARHLWVKLAAVGCALAPASGRTERFEFTEAEVDALARLEHERWVDERREDGWSPGPRDPAAKRTPYLVPWSELSEEIRELDRVAVTGLPSFLAGAGYEIVRAHDRTRPLNRG